MKIYLLKNLQELSNHKKKDFPETKDPISYKKKNNNKKTTIFIRFTIQD